MTRRILLTGLSLLLAFSSMPRLGSSAAAANASDFMNDLWSRAAEVLAKKVPPAERLGRFRQLFRSDFDGLAIARFVLGRYWHSASDEERQEFLKLFEDYVVYVYGTRLSDFNGETFRVRGSRTDGDGTVVSTDVFTPGANAPIKIDWRLSAENGGFKITDVIIEGISLLATQRSEFASVIQRHGGQVGGLLALMREKTNVAAAQ